MRDETNADADDEGDDERNVITDFAEEFMKILTHYFLSHFPSLSIAS